jgi:mRNA interferase MazF
VAKVNRGEIWQFSFPSPNRRRPVLILTRQEVIGHLHSVTVAPITTTIRGIPSEVVIGPESGLKTTSAINLDNLATVPRDGLRSFVGAVSPEVLTAVRMALLFALGFDDPEKGT